MVNLFDILSGMPRRQEFGTLDTKVVEVLEPLNNLEPESGSRVDLYLNILPQFLQGIEDEHENIKSNTTSPFYVVGRGQGFTIVAEMRKAKENKNNEATDSYTRVYGQLRDALSALIEELKSLKQAIESPYDFLILHIPKGEGMDGVISNGLVKILTSYKNLAEDLARGILDEGVINQIEKIRNPQFDDYVKIGIIYLFGGDIYRAQNQFLSAIRREPNKEISPAVRDIAHNIKKADSILYSVYSKIQLAHQFEFDGNQIGLIKHC